MFGKNRIWKCELNYKKGYKNEGPLNYFEKILTYEFEHSIEVNILGTFLKKQPCEEANWELQFLMELQKELSWIDKTQKVTVLST